MDVVLLPVNTFKGTIIIYFDTFIIPMLVMFIYTRLYIL